MCGSTHPSSGTQTPPKDRGAVRLGQPLEDLVGRDELDVEARPRGRLAARRRSSQLASLEAIRTLPTVSNTCSSR